MDEDQTELNETSCYILSSLFIILLTPMPLTNAFAKQSRQQIVKSNINKSVSKHFWSFPKKQRFAPLKTECPVTFYQEDVSTLNPRKASFPLSRRKVFTQVTDAPLPGAYQPSVKNRNKAPILSQGRQKCTFNSYISKQLKAHPAPNQYVKQQRAYKKHKGYTFRPQTAKHRNYFIEDQEQKDVPSPVTYNIQVDQEGKSYSSKFRSTTLGQSLRKTQSRFNPVQIKTPGPSQYIPQTTTLKSQSTGGAIGGTIRKSFIDLINKKLNDDPCPGPGNYQLPTQFGHYKSTHRSLNNKTTV